MTLTEAVFLASTPDRVDVLLERVTAAAVKRGWPALDAVRFAAGRLGRELANLPAWQRDVWLERLDVKKLALAGGRTNARPAVEVRPNQLLDAIFAD